MHLSWESVPLTKRHALTISRGTITGAVSVVVGVEADGITGYGEMAPSTVTGDTPESCVVDLRRWEPVLERHHPSQRQAVHHDIAELGGGSATVCALDQAMHDWIGKRAGLPLWQLWGLDRTPIPPTSLTIGINPPHVVRAVTAEILSRTHARILKVKLGSPEGIEHDREVLAAAQEAAAPFGDIVWRVDANGGWNVPSALSMLPWLAERGVELVEQPLAQGAEDQLPVLFHRTPLPLYADESVATASDIPGLADRVHGVNLKLMKAGGITEAFRLIHTARAHGLRVMIGCMGESSLSISAGAQLAPLLDAVDLDSHLNLVDDPFVGPLYSDGTVWPSNGPGLGVTRRVTKQQEEQQ